MAMRQIGTTADYELFDSRLNYPRHVKGRFSKRGVVTIITAKDARGNITFRSEEPRAMTQQEIDAELAKWCINLFREEVDIVIG